MPDFSREIELGGIVAGIDEAGRGPLAGPVAAAAVIIDRDKIAQNLTLALDDSKKLTAKKRELLYSQLEKDAAVKIGFALASVEEIDELNILQAALLAMARAYNNLATNTDFALVDGNKLPKLPCRSFAVVGGDGLSVSIAAASIVAKVRRDRIMQDLDRDFPQYGWQKNSGYGTKQHILAIKDFGITPHHRKSFAPISDFFRK